MKEWKLPNGEYTSNAKKMSKAWKDIYKPICRVTGSVVIGYNPGISYPGILFKSDYGKGCSFDLPLSIAQKISEMIKALEDCDKYRNSWTDISEIVSKALTPPPRPEIRPTNLVGKDYWGIAPGNKTKKSKKISYKDKRE